MKKIILLFVTAVYFFLNGNSFSQPQTEWIQRYNNNGDSNEDLRDMAIDKAGNIYITGYTYSPSTLEDIITLKYSTQGVLLWARMYNGPSNRGDIGVNVKVDDSNYIYVAGETFNASQFNNFLLIKYDQNGITKWTRELDGGGSFTDQPKDMVLDDSSNVYLTGYGFTPNWVVGDYLTVKYDRNGVLKWLKFFNNSGTYSEFANTIALDNSKRVIVTGLSSLSNGNTVSATIIYNNFGDTIRTIKYNNAIGWGILTDKTGNVYIGGDYRNNNQDDIFINKYSEQGNLLWNYTYGTSDTIFTNDYFSSMHLDNQNKNIYLTGKSNVDNQNGWDYLILKYSLDGDSIWKRGYSLTPYSSNSSNHMAIDKFNNVYVTGSSDYNTPSYRFLTVKYDSAGNFKWSASYTNYLFADHYGKRVFVDTSNNIYVGGTSYGVGTGSDIALIKYSLITNVTQQSNINIKDYSLSQNYPNPFNPKTIIRFQIPAGSINNSNILLKVYDVLGKEVAILIDQIENPGSYKIEWDASNYSSGIYLYSLIVNNKIIDTKKLILIK